ncbi:MAG TPA: hypothetical protein VFF24_00665 [Acidimicrobiia bacterium]|nr:hypothetical protein [Acidimicrobiia bacterium]
MSGSWRRIAEAPVPPTGGMAAAWTGRQLVVWGGQAGDGGHQAAGDGAAYDPVMDRWEELPASPIAGRYGASAVWTGREVLFWGGQGQPDILFPDGASYDPATRRWRPVPAAPIGARTNHQAVWTGTEMVVWGGFRRCCPIDSVIHDPAAAAYDPVSDKWRRIADVPPGARPDALPSDPVLPTIPDGQAGASIAVGGPGRIYAAAGQSARVLEYRIADDRWEELPLPPISTRSAAVLVWTGSELLFWGGIGDEGPEMDGAAWRPAG